MVFILLKTPVLRERMHISVHHYELISRWVRRSLSEGDKTKTLGTSEIQIPQTDSLSTSESPQVLPVVHNRQRPFGKTAVHIQHDRLSGESLGLPKVETADQKSEQRQHIVEGHSEICGFRQIRHLHERLPRPLVSYVQIVRAVLSQFHCCGQGEWF